MKKWIALIAAAIVLLGIALYFIFFTGNELETGTPENPFEGTGSGDVGFGEDGGDDGAIFLGGAGEELAPRFIKITDGPVSPGAVAFVTSIVESFAGDAATSTLEVPEKEYEVRYIDRKSGNVYSYYVLKQSSTRLSNRTLPGIQEASWLPDGSIAYVRYSPDGISVETYALPAEGEGGFLLENNLSQASVQPDGTVLTALPSSSGTLLSFLGATGEALSPAISIPLAQAVVALGGDTLFATTRASSALDGYAFEISPSGAFSRVLGPLRGLATLPSPNGTYLLHSYISRGAVRTALLNTETRESTSVPVGTLAEKCVWAKDETRLYCAVPKAISGTLPDAWYQGAVSFSDRIWSVSLSERVATQVVDPEAFGEPIDAVALALDDEMQVLVFTDKRSGALYLYDL